MSEQFEPTPTPAPVTSRVQSDSIGTILLGGIVAMFGLLWLLDSAGAIDSPWYAVLPGMLIIIGVALVIGSRTGSHPGLIVLGAVITVALTVTSMVDIPLGGGIGDRVVRPMSITAVDNDYELFIGQQTIDLREVEFPAGETRIRARVGMGELHIRVPTGVEVLAEWRVGVGDADVLGTERSGVGLRDDTNTAGYTSASQRLVLDLSVGIGSLVVQHGP
jgi:predicted membrane protein